MALPTSKTDICNLALGRIGHKLTTLDLITADTDPDAMQCNLHYEQTRDALLRSYWWRFAGARIDLAVVINGDFAHWTSDDPDDWDVTDDAVATDEVSEVGAGEGHDGTGTKKCNIYSVADGTGVQILQEITTVVGLEYKFSINIDTITDGELAVENLPEPTSGDTDWDSIGTKTVTFTADDTSFDLVIKGHTDALNITFDNISVVVVPAFEWSYGYTLPSDFLAMRSIWGENQSNENTIYSYALEGNLLLSNENVMRIRYTKQMTVADFDPLFIEVLVLSLAVKLCMPLAQDNKLYRDLREELYGRKGLMSRVRAMDKQEQNTVGIADHGTWLAAFRTSRDPTRLGSE